MLGWDGVAERQSVTFVSVAALINVVPAPAAGFEIVVFAMWGTANSVVNVSFQNGVPTVLSNNVHTAQRPFSVSSDRPLFRCGDAQPLDIPNAGLVQIQYTVTFEIRPTGL